MSLINHSYAPITEPFTSKMSYTIDQDDSRKWIHENQETCTNPGPIGGNQFITALSSLPALLQTYIRHQGITIANHYQEMSFA